MKQPTKSSGKKAASDGVQTSTKQPVVFWVVFLLLSVPMFSRLVTGFFLNIDDELFFTNNPHLRSLSPGNLLTIFSTTYGGNYHPVTTLLEAIEFALFGLKPAGFHVVSLLVHLLNSYLVYRVAGRFSERLDFKMLLTVLFAFHPMHVESVAWITDQTDLFCTAFMLLSIDRHIVWLNNGSRKPLLLSFLFFLLALGSKPAAVAVPFLLPVIAWHFGKWSVKRIPVLMSFLLPALVFTYVTYVALSAITRIDAELLPDYSLLQRLVVANFAFAYYILTFVFPFGLSVLHLAPSELPLHYYLAIPFNVLLLFFLWHQRKRLPTLITGFLFYSLTIGLVVQLLPTGYNVVAERYTYFPYIGISMMLAFLVLADREGSLQLPTLLKGRLQQVTYGFVVYLSILSFVRIGEWKDLVTINRGIAEYNPGSAYAQLSAALQELEIGDTESAVRRIAESERLDSNSAQLNFTRGRAYYKLGRFDKALSSFQQSQRSDPYRKELVESLAILYFQNNKMDSAEVYFSKLIATDSVPVAANLSNRAICRYYLKDYRRAIDDFTAAVHADPSMGSALAQRGICYAEMGEPEKGCKDLRAAVRAGYTEFQSEVDKYCGK